ncbi:MAG: hypothetical protein SGJ13_11355, partial [Actinomycetota bacterium]|nr:hypothetical protein [Actinomycetota bacterium]
MTRSETDAVVTAAGPTLVLGRQYTSDDEFDSGCQNPENWTNGALSFVDDSEPGSLRIAGSALQTITVDIAGGGSGPWPLPGPTSRVLIQTSATVGGSSVNVWRITDPGRTTTDYYRTSGAMDPELVALDGLLLQTQDPSGNLHFYDYAFYGIENPVPRLRRIFVNGTPQSLSLGTPPDALVEFGWIQDGDDTGRLERMDVFRFVGEGKVLVQRVAYTYFDDAVHHADVGTSGDLVQVVVSERLDPVVGAGGATPFGVESWRRRVTQYRYHGGGEGASAGVTGRYTWAGGAHQIKLVIEPEQFEYLAQRLVAQGDGPGGLPVYDVDQLAPVALGMADGDLVWANDADGDGEVTSVEEAPLVDFATMVAATYETFGGHRILTVSSTSGGGCGTCGAAGTQGSLLVYDYVDRDSDPSVAETVKIEQRLRNLAGTSPVFETTPYRTYWLEYDRPAGAGDVPYLRSSAVQEQGGASRRWVTLYQHDPSTRTLLAEYTPAAVSAYTPGTAMAAPSYTIATSGLVLVSGWTADNRLARREVSDGQPTFTGTACTDCVLVEETIYGDGTGNTRKHLSNEMRRYRKDPDAVDFDSSTDVETTKYTYAFHGGSGDDVAWIKTEVEAELVAENGPGTPAWYASYDIFDDRGDNVWSVAADGAITAREFESGNAGQLLKVVRNAPNTLPSTIAGLSTTGFGRNSDGGALETRYARDLMGRVRETIQPGDVSTYTLRNSFSHPDRPGIRYSCDVTLPPVVDAATGQYGGPASVTWYTAAGQMFAASGYRPGIGGYQFAAPAASQAGWPILVSGYMLAEELSRRIVRHDVAGQVKAVMEWNALTGPLPVDPQEEPEDLLDGPNNGVHVTLFGQDRLGRPFWTINANGTAERLSYDVLDRVVATEVGLADIGDWVPDDATMKFVARSYYDSGTSTTAGVGNGNLTRIDQVVSGSGMSEVVRSTILKYDWRDRRYSAVNPLPPHDWTEFDNLDRVVRHAVFTAEPTAINAPLDSGADFRGRYAETSYSQRGLVYRRSIATNPKSSSPTFIESHTWFDQVGRSVGAWGPNGPMQKMSYDGLGRPKIVYLSDRRSDPLPGASGNFAAVFNLSTHATNVSDDVVLEQSSSRYVTGRGVMDFSTRRVRTHDATTSDVGALDSGGYPSSKVITTYSGAWYDAANRAIRQAEYGSNATGFQSGGSAPSIVQSAPPASNAADATKLVTETSYDARGLVDTVTDPMSRMTKFHHDALGRRIMVIENFDPSNPVEFVWEGPLDQVADVLMRRWKIVSGLDIDHPDRNRATSFVYDGLGNVVRQAAYLVELESDFGDPPTFTPVTRMQETAYLYDSGRRFNGEIESNDLLAEIHYPDSQRQVLGPPTEPQPVRFEYNRQSEVVETWDANVTQHVYTRDALGRVTLDKATVSTSISAFQIDDTVDAIASEFDTLGRLRTSRSYTQHGTGGQAVVNAVQFGYDDLWQVASATQQPDGDISGGSDSVGIDYDIQPVASGNRSRRTVLSYPDGWELEAAYGASGSINDRISRVGSLLEEGTSNGYVDYSYVGV